MKLFKSSDTAVNSNRTVQYFFRIELPSVPSEKFLANAATNDDNVIFNA